MPYIPTTALRKLLALTKRIRAVAGGTGASKTIGIIQILIDKAQSDSTPKKTSVVSESFPHLEKGAIADFKSIMMQHGYWRDNLWNETKHFYTFETGSIIEFFSADQWDKVKGPRRDRLFINEANNVPFESFEQGPRSAEPFPFPPGHRRRIQAREGRRRIQAPLARRPRTFGESSKCFAQALR